MIIELLFFLLVALVMAARIGLQVLLEKRPSPVPELLAHSQARVALAQGQAAQAVQLATQALEPPHGPGVQPSTPPPHLPALYLLRAQARLQLGHYRLALQDATQAISRDIHLAGAYLARAQAHYHLGQLPLALENLEYARQINDRLPHLHYLHALVLEGLGQPDRARPYFRTAAALARLDR